MSVFIGTVRLFEPFFHVEEPVVREEVPDVGGGNETGHGSPAPGGGPVRISGERGRGAGEAVITVVVPGSARTFGKTDARAWWMLAVRRVKWRRPEVLRGGETEGDDPARGEPPGAFPEEFPGVEPVGLPGGGLRHADQDQVVARSAFRQEAARIGHDEMDGGVGERGLDDLGEMGPRHRDQDRVELNPVDPRRAVPEEFPDRPVDPPAEEEDAAADRDAAGRPGGRRAPPAVPPVSKARASFSKTEICPARAVTVIRP